MRANYPRHIDLQFTIYDYMNLTIVKPRVKSLLCRDKSLISGHQGLSTKSAEIAGLRHRAQGWYKCISLA